jgi:hypothetical protein
MVSALVTIFAHKADVGPGAEGLPIRIYDQ